MIKNNKTSKDFIAKRFAKDTMLDISVSDLMSDIGTYVNENVDSVNALNDRLLQALDITASGSTEILSNLNMLASRLGDLYSISGATKESFDPYMDNIQTRENLGMYIDYDTQNIRLAPTFLNSITPNNVKVTFRSGQLGTSDPTYQYKLNDVNSIVSDSSYLAVESIGSELIFSVEVNLGQQYIINNISFALNNIGVLLPNISSLKAFQPDGSHKDVVFSISNSTSVNIEDFRFSNGNISLDFPEISTNKIILSFSQKNSYSVDGVQRFAAQINKLRVGFKTNAQNGSIVIGPFSTTSQILKVSLFADTIRNSIEDGNINFYISSNLSDWYNIENTNVFNPASLKKKVLNFNNIEDKSIRTAQPIKDIYLKIEMKAIDVTGSVNRAPDAAKYRALLTDTSKTINADNITDLNSNVFQIQNKKFGTSISYNKGSTVSISDHTIGISSNGLFVPFSIREDDIINISKESFINEFDNVRVYTKPEKVFVINSDTKIGVPRNGFDPYSISFSKVSKPTIRPMSIETDSEFVVKNTSSMFVLGINKNAGKYLLNFSNKARIIVDFSEGFAYSNSQLIYLVDSDVSWCKISNEIGEHIATVPAQEFNGNRYISILDAFNIEIPVIEGFVYADKFPVKQLEEKEFAIQNGNIYFGSYCKSIINGCHILVKEPISSIPDVGISFGKRQILRDNKQIKTSYQMLGNDLKKTIKLMHTDIVDGSVKFDTSKASMNAFIKEVQFIDGIKEFNPSKLFLQIGNTNKNIIDLDVSFDNSGYIEFSGNVDLFKNQVFSEDELVNPGDWMLHYDGSMYRIKLPLGVYTNSISDTEISYTVKSEKLSNSGMYSIDYKRGILHTSSPIDHKTIISYIYSFVFSSYEAMDKLEMGQYRIRPNSVEILKDISPEKNGFLVTVQENSASDVKYLTSPIIKELKLNIITEDNFLWEVKLLTIY